MKNPIDVQDEEIPMLETDLPKQTRTPLPKLQIGIILFLQMCEPLCSQSINPYINELVGTLDVIGGNPQRIGYYAGLIESLFFATEALTVFQWSRVSDKVGRKPVLMIGLSGTMLSIVSFGLSRTFAMLVTSRCLAGLLNGNIGVMKSAMGELTDSTNRAEAFALTPVVWSFGSTFGPFLGGTLARPSDRFPLIFTWKFWREYPYFLPCLVTSASMFLALVITGLLFEETTDKWRHITKPNPSCSEVSLVEGVDSKNVSFRSLLTFPVVISVANYATLAFLEASVNALLPLFFHMPLDMGGLGLGPAAIGCLMGLYGCGTGLFQAFFFAKLVRTYGIRRIFIMSMITFIPVFMMFPLISLVARHLGLCWIVWVLIAAMFALLLFMNTAYGCIFMYVTNSAPSRRSLGATNGLAQTAVSTARAIGPALSTSLFSFSVQRNIIGGYGAYAMFVGLSLSALLLAFQLPSQVWTSKSRR